MGMIMSWSVTRLSSNLTSLFLTLSDLTASCSNSPGSGLSLCPPWPSVLAPRPPWVPRPPGQAAAKCPYRTSGPLAPPVGAGCSDPSLQAQGQTSLRTGPPLLTV